MIPQLGFQFPNDVLVAMATMLVLSVLLGWGGIVASRKNKRLGLVLGACAALLLLVHAVWMNDNLSLTHWFKSANLVIWSNLAGPAAALLAGVAWERFTGPSWQRWACVIVLATVGLGRMIEPLIGAMPVLGTDRWVDGMCRQSTPSTCSAAAAATFLRLNGINTSEAEMAGLCLTRARGTSNLGLYRGLKLKADAIHRSVRAGNPSFDELRQWPTPAIVTIKLKIDDVWIPIGNRHSVVLLEFNDDGTIEIADPFAGRQRWRREELRQRFGGSAIALSNFE